MHFAHIGQRFCSRCYKALTDAASMEVGVGPVCRNLDNALLAQTIPSNIEAAVAAYQSLDVGTLSPEVVNTFIKIETDLVADGAATRLDWREVVKRIEWMRSYGMPSKTDEALIAIVKALGYIGIVSMWCGEASSGEATCSFADGRFIVSGPQNKAFRISIKKVSGYRFHYAKTGEDRPSWSLPASQGAAFKSLVATHYPNHKGLQDALASAGAFLASQPAPEATPVAPAAPEPVQAAPSAYVKVAEGGALLLKTPYNGGFIAEIKTIPYKSRAWDGIDKVWKVSPEYKARALATLLKFFPDADTSAAQ